MQAAAGIKRIFQDTNHPTIPLHSIIYHTFTRISTEKALEKKHKSGYFKAWPLFRDVAQWLARLLWEQDVAGSTPAIPTIFLQKMVNEAVRLSLHGTQCRFMHRWCASYGKAVLHKIRLTMKHCCVSLHNMKHFRLRSVWLENEK